MESARKQYPYLDLAKLFFCVCIVAIHSGLTGGSITFYLDKAVFRLGVPFFFLVSGFLLGEKMISRNVGSLSDVKMTIRNYCVRLLKPLVVFEIINIILAVIRQIKSGGVFWNTYPH